MQTVLSGFIALFATLFSFLSQLSEIRFPVLGVADRADAVHKCLAQPRHLSWAVIY